MVMAAVVACVLWERPPGKESNGERVTGELLRQRARKGEGEGAGFPV